jgi:hypothetical protein
MKPALKRYRGLALLPPILLPALLLAAGLAGCSDSFPPPDAPPTAPPGEKLVVVVPGQGSDTRNVRLTLPDSISTGLAYGELIRYDRRAHRMILERDDPQPSIVIAGLDGSESILQKDQGPSPKLRFEPEMTAVSPDGTTAACIVTRSVPHPPGRSDDSAWIRIIDLRSGSTRFNILLAAGRDNQSQFAFSAPGFSPDGRCLALFGFDPSIPASQILLIPTDGAGSIRGSAGVIAVDNSIAVPDDRATLQWSPDGARVAFVARAAATGSWNLLVADTANITMTPHITGVRSDSMIDFDWASTEPKIAMSAVIFDDRRDLWIFSLNSGEFTRLTQDSVVERFPNWSPDGAQILYTSYAPGVTAGPGTLMSIYPGSMPRRTRTIADSVIKAFWE